ncbi:MAG TPA: hypothetical protein VJT73_15235 [Polyangiaceae bacterium]|nr:hypothetical protein [Polyangiaceae bacterium]
MSDAPRRGSFAQAALALAFLVPFAVTLGHVGPSSVWRDDLALLRGIAWVENGRSGALSAVLVQASFFLSLGTLPFRAGVATSLVVGSVGLALYALTRDLLEKNVQTPSLGPALATAAACTATLSATGQREGTVAGGGCLAVLLALLMLREGLLLRAQRDPRRAVFVGTLLGALAVENFVVAGASFVALAARMALAPARLTRRAGLALLLSAFATAGLLAAPLYLRPLAEPSFLDWGRSVSAMGGALPFEGPWRALGGVGCFRAEIGVVPLGLALAGAAVAIARARLRSDGLALAIVALVDLGLAHLGERGFWSNEELAALHGLTMGALSVGTAVSVHTAAATLLESGLPMARGTTVFLVMGNWAIVAASAEEASFSADRSGLTGAEAFTDEAFVRLAPQSAVLVRTRASALRLAAAELTTGARPDVVLVPTSVVGDSRLAFGLLRRETALASLMRDVSLDGRPGEPSLTTLADVRPTLVELDPGWDRRVVSHLVPSHLWLRFAPEPLGPSDRKAAFIELRARVDQVLAPSRLGERQDPSTAAAIRLRLTDATAEAAMLGDREQAIALLEQLGKVASGDRFVNELTLRIAASKGGPIDVKTLLR